MDKRRSHRAAPSPHLTPWTFRNSSMSLCTLLFSTLRSASDSWSLTSQGDSHAAQRLRQTAAETSLSRRYPRQFCGRSRVARLLFVERHHRMRLRRNPSFDSVVSAPLARASTSVFDCDASCNNGRPQPACGETIISIGVAGAGQHPLSPVSLGKDSGLNSSGRS